MTHQRDLELVRITPADGPDVVVSLAEETLSDGSQTYKVVIVCGGGTVLMELDAGGVNEAYELFGIARAYIAPNISTVEVIKED